MLVDAHSGLAGIAYWMNNQFGKNGRRFEKQDELVAKVKADVDALYAQGRTTTMSDAELRAICHKYAPELSPDK